mmetsp:Transcript_31745/g.69386  ORF Transcript_31745/g.69386 Transcript_31745/m.69386 type:complete len:276 (-) Transcript_31745:382-1209(-)|eukprot:CAMPEP_0118948884 /NCGR_PEP_ID=MMETSP1169-20130426/48611_1 /TAXON_ID=36882 /ORGANISM="Pyramimonas obovata, Strain CCMP722" /LENGTH=275 /DNA_ID=CAMNT_0006895403 /DNA_START=21 /DNA_END=848 /DNA_ORIENTATION=-
MAPCARCDCNSEWQKSLRRDTATATCNYTSMTMKECRAKMQGLKKRLDAATDENTILQSKNEDLTALNAELERREKEMYTRNQELVARLEHAQKINQVLHERMSQTSADLNSRLSETYTNLKSTSTQMELLHVQRKNIETQLKDCETQLNSARQERDDMQIHCEKMEQQNHELHRALEMCNNDLQASLDQQDQEMQTQVNHWVHRWQVEAQTRHDTDARCVALETRCRDLERQVSLLSSQRAALEASLETKCEMEARRREQVSRELAKYNQEYMR